MITVRRSEDRGHFDHGWLDTYHTFSFGEYRDEAHMGFRDLRVINEDRVAPGQGFGTHGHRDMEILTYVISGVVAHKDSLGNRVEIRAGELQRMSAGTGVTHSEFNPDAENPLHFLQIWVEPRERGLAPEYDQREFSYAEKSAGLRLVVSPDGAEGSLAIHQDVRVFASVLEQGRESRHRLEKSHSAWVQLIRGSIELRVGEDDPVELNAGDGASIVLPNKSDSRELVLRGTGPESEALLFDLLD